MIINTPLVSVIVPIYNVERFVGKCLDSLIKQTLKQIEIICIDDGSTDDSKRIVGEYENYVGWPKLRVIHTENRGLSAARNRGIDEAEADWLMFVDSDDWVDSNFCGVPYEIAIKENAEMVVFAFSITTGSGRVKRKKSINDTNGFTDFETIIDNGDTMVWNKLYKRTLFNDVRYPEGHVYEDVATTHKLVFRAKTIYECPEKLYFYRSREGSISKSVYSRVDEYKAKVQRYGDLIAYGYPKDKANSQLLMASLAYCGHAVNMEDSLYKEAKKTIHEIKERTDDLKLKQKILLSVWNFDERLYRGMYWLLGKRMSI